MTSSEAPGRPPSASKRRSKPRSRGADALDQIAPSELATVLRVLLAKHPDLRQEAESIAVEMVSSPDVEDVAEDVVEAVTSLGVDRLHGRAGKQRWGYVEPSEAAWELLEEGLECHLDDMKRCVALGLHDAATAICCGIVLGLHKAESSSSDGLLGWAPDFPAETACQAAVELVKICPAEARASTRERLVEAVGVYAPDWGSMVARALDRVITDR
jgi:hypothetical protein